MDGSERSATRALTTDDHEELYAYLLHCQKQGYTPSVREIADMLDLSPTATHYRISVLEEMGWIKKVPGYSRKHIELTK